MRKKQVLRILDANRNRAVEAFRVLEEIARFANNDSAQSKTLKDARHKISELIATYGYQEMLSSRDTAGDVGTKIIASDEYHRIDIQSMLAANFQRLTQALRVLEEYTKLMPVESANVEPSSISSQIESIRYQTYQLEKEMSSQGVHQSRLDQANLCVLVPAFETKAKLEKAIVELVQGGATMIQLREKNLDDRTLLSLATFVVGILDSMFNENSPEQIGSRPLLIVNDRPDLCQMSGADGVHLGQDDLPIGQVRSWLGDEKLIGVSTHSVEQAKTAQSDGADYIGVGPTFQSSTKQFDSYHGTELLSKVAQEIKIPAFAIGGITLENLDLVLKAGFDRIAVAGGVLRSDNLAQTTRQFTERLSQ